MPLLAPEAELPPVPAEPPEPVVQAPGISASAIVASKKRDRTRCENWRRLDTARQQWIAGSESVEDFAHPASITHARARQSPIPNASSGDARARKQ